MLCLRKEIEDHRLRTIAKYKDLKKENEMLKVLLIESETEKMKLKEELSEIRRSNPQLLCDISQQYIDLIISGGILAKYNTILFDTAKISEVIQFEDYTDHPNCFFYKFQNAEELWMKLFGQNLVWI